MSGNPLSFRVFQCALAAAILLCTPCGTSFAQDKPLIMVTEQWPPFRISDPAAPAGFRGIDVDLIDKLATVIKRPILIQRHPWARALEQMRNGQADLITGIARTPEREGFMYFVPVSYCAVRPVFYTQKGKGRLVQSYEDLYGPSVGYSLKSAYFEPFNSDTRIQKLGLSNEEQLLRVLALGRVDLIIGTEPNLSYDIARLEYQELLEPTVYQPPQKTDLFIALSRKSTVMNLSEEIEKALRDLTASGTVNTILETYR